MSKKYVTILFLIYRIQEAYNISFFLILYSSFCFYPICLFFVKKTILYCSFHFISRGSIDLVLLLFNLPFEQVPLIALYNPDKLVAVSLKLLQRLSQFEVMTDDLILSSVQHTAAKFCPGIEKGKFSVKTKKFYLCIPWQRMLHAK